MRWTRIKHAMTSQSRCVSEKCCVLRYVCDRMGAMLDADPSGMWPSPSLNVLHQLVEVSIHHIVLNVAIDEALDCAEEVVLVLLVLVVVRAGQAD